eukprot:2753389-Pyramimonas_sp.AAC.1
MLGTASGTQRRKEESLGSQAALHLHGVGQAAQHDLRERFLRYPMLLQLCHARKRRRPPLRLLTRLDLGHELQLAVDADRMCDDV